MLKHLKRVSIQFGPGDPKSTSARELLQRLGCDNARKSNPKCELDFKSNETLPSGSSSVELVFNDDQKRELKTSDMRIADIVKVIEQKAVEMELRSVFQEVKYDPFKKT